MKEGRGEGREDTPSHMADRARVEPKAYGGANHLFNHYLLFQSLFTLAKTEREAMSIFQRRYKSQLGSLMLMPSLPLNVNAKCGN